MSGPIFAAGVVYVALVPFMFLFIWSTLVGLYKGNGWKGWNGSGAKHNYPFWDAINLFVIALIYGAVWPIGLISAYVFSDQFEYGMAMPTFNLRDVSEWGWAGCE